MEITKNALIDVATELNETREAGINTSSKTSVERLTKAILKTTDNGANLKKLSKAARALIASLVEAPESEEKPSKPEKAEAPKKEAKKATAKKDAVKKPAKDSGTEPDEVEGEQEAGGELQDDENYYLTREAANVAAMDMNDVLGLSPGIDTTLDDADFFARFEQGAGYVEPDDNLMAQTWSVLQARGLGPVPAREEPVVAPSVTKKAALKKDAVKKQEEAPAESPKKATLKKAEKTPSKPEKAEAPKKEAKKAALKKDAVKKPAAKKSDQPAKRKGPGIIQTIIAFVEATDGRPFSRDALHEQIVARFPQRDPLSLLATIRTQVPRRMTADNGYKFEKLEDKSYIVTLPKGGALTKAENVVSEAEVKPILSSGKKAPKAAIKTAKATVEKEPAAKKAALKKDAVKKQEEAPAESPKKATLKKPVKKAAKAPEKAPSKSAAKLNKGKGTQPSEKPEKAAESKTAAKTKPKLKLVKK